jgi:hypothetical protein
MEVKEAFDTEEEERSLGCSRDRQKRSTREQGNVRTCLRQTG